MRRLLAITTALSLLAPNVWAQDSGANGETVSSRPDGATVVIYRDQPVDTVQLMAQARQPWVRMDRQGLALIVETRTVDLPAGEGIIRFRGLATGVVPQSAVLEGLPAHVVERNTDFDLLTPASLMEKSVGEVVRVVRTNPQTGEQVEKAAVIRAGAQGTVLEIDGRYEALSCSGTVDRVVFDHVPEGLADQPTLSVRTRATEAGRHTVTLAYLTTGLQWSADYVAQLNPEGGSLDLTGWITLANFGGTSFPDAPVQVVAGTLRKDAGTRPVEPLVRYSHTECWPQGTTTLGADEIASFGAYPPPSPPPPPPVAAPMMRMAAKDAEEIVVTGSRIARQGELGDYKIYTLPEPTTVAARQTKQVRFLERDGVAYERVYRAGVLNTDEESRPMGIVMKLRNVEGAGLGLALPGGSMAVMQPDGAGSYILAGQDRFEDKGVGLPVRLHFGNASEVRVQTREVANSSSKRGAVTTNRVEVETTITNARSEPVTVELVANAAMQRGFRIRSQSIRSRIDDTGYPVWTMTVPASGAATLKAAWTTTD